MSVRPSPEIDHANKIHAMMLSENKEEAQTALNKYRNLLLVKQGLDATDVAIYVKNWSRPGVDPDGALVRQYRDDLDKLSREHDILQAEHQVLHERLIAALGEGACKSVVREANLELWHEFEQLSTRLFKRRPAKWAEQAADHLGETEATIKRWQRGTARIPTAIMDYLRQLPGPESELSPVVLAPKISVEQARSIFRRRISGERADAIASAVGVTHRQVEQLMWDRQPLPGLDVEVRSGTEPTDWWELWELSSYVLGRSQWLTRIFGHFGCPRRDFPCDPNEFCDPQRLQKLRSLYWSGNAPWPLFKRTIDAKVAQMKAAGQMTPVSAWDFYRQMLSNAGIQKSNEWIAPLSNRYNKEFGYTIATKAGGTFGSKSPKRPPVPSPTTARTSRKRAKQAPPGSASSG